MDDNFSRGLHELLPPAAAEWLDRPGAQGFVFAVTFMVVFAVIMIIAAIAARRRRAMERAAQDALDAREIAEIIETVSFSGAGGFCVVMLIVTWAVSGMQFLLASTVLQQTVSLLMWIGGSAFFGIAAMLSRRRSYRIYRSEFRAD